MIAITIDAIDQMTDLINRFEGKMRMTAIAINSIDQGTD